MTGTRTGGQAGTRYLLITVAAALCGGFVWLGVWQLDRAAEKHALFRDYDRRSRSSATLAQALGRPAAVRYQRLRVTGRFDASRQFLIDNVVTDGQVGYFVLTPLRLQRERLTLLVNRGWIAAGATREALPEIEVDNRLRVVDGLIDRFPRRGVRLGPDSSEGWPRVIQDPRAAGLAEALGQQIAPFQLLLEPSAADGYGREWRPQLMGPERHFGYAFQWFALAGTVAVVCAVLVFRRGRDEG